MAEVSDAAQRLRDRHLSGPAAAHVLAQALAGVAILSEDASSEDECVILRGQVDGPLKGFLVEANGKGELRGYTNTKLLHDADAHHHTDTQAVLGAGADMQIVRSRPARILDQAQLRVVPPSIQVAVAKYFNQSMQIPSAVEIVVTSDHTTTSRALGVCVQRMPDSNQQAFIHALEAFHRGDVRSHMLESPTPESLGQILGLPDLVVTASRPIRFHCHCSRARVLASLHALSLEDRMTMLASTAAHHIVCHLCGQDYLIEHDDIPPPA